ncbi:MAG: cobalt ECF transporter T component CbiQ [Candidatus Bathyarchaeia archaeon]
MSHDDLYAQIDRCAYTNALAKDSPVTKMFFALSGLIISVSSPSPIVPIIVFATFTILLLSLAKVPMHLYLDLLIYPTVMLAVSCLILALFFGTGEALAVVNTPWFTWTIYRSGITLSIVTFLRVESGLSCLFFLVLTTAMTDIFLTLRRAHVPKVLIEMSLLIYRYIFVFIEVAEKMSTAQKLRLGHSGWLRRIRSLALLSGNLFIRTLEQGQRTLIAMNARGYDGNIRVLEDQPKASKLALFGVTAFVVLLVLVAWLTMNFRVV